MGSPVSYLLDTNIVSEFTRPQIAPGVYRFLDKTPLDAQFISDIVIGEVNFGITLLPDEERRLFYADALNNRIRPMFIGRVLSADKHTWVIWKRLEREGRKRGYTYPQPDLVIAALAKQHAMTIVTRDGKPFREAGIPTFDPWAA